MANKNKLVVAFRGLKLDFKLINRVLRDYKRQDEKAGRKR